MGTVNAKRPVFSGYHMGTKVPIQQPFWGGVSLLQPMRSIVLFFAGLDTVRKVADLPVSAHCRAASGGAPPLRSPGSTAGPDGCVGDADLTKPGNVSSVPRFPPPFSPPRWVTWCGTPTATTRLDLGITEGQCQERAGVLTKTRKRLVRPAFSPRKRLVPPAFPARLDRQPVRPAVSATPASRKPGNVSFVPRFSRSVVDKDGTQPRKCGEQSAPNRAPPQIPPWSPLSLPIEPKDATKCRINSQRAGCPPIKMPPRAGRPVTVYTRCQKAGHQ